MNSINNVDTLWTAVTAEELETRDEFGCLFEWDIHLECFCFSCFLFF